MLRTIKTSWILAGLLVSRLLGSGAFTQSADTGCGIMPKPRPNGAPKLQFVALHEDENAPIVGLWKIALIAEGNADIPDGVVIDSGYATCTRMEPNL